MSECDQELATVLFSREKDKNKNSSNPTNEADAIRQRYCYSNNLWLCYFFLVFLSSYSGVVLLLSASCGLRHMTAKFLD